MKQYYMNKIQFITISNINPLDPFPLKCRVITHQIIRELQLE